MPKLAFLLTALLSASLLMAQSPERVVIAGQVEHFEEFPENAEVIFSVSVPLGFRADHNAKIDPDGHFHTSFEIGHPSEVVTGYGDNGYVKLPFRPGDSLFVRFDASAETKADWFQSIEITGNRPEYARQAVAFQEQYDAAQPDWQERERRQQDTVPENLLAYADSLRAQNEALAEAFIAEVQPDEAMQSWIRHMAYDSYFDLLSDYPNTLARAVGPENLPEMPERFDTFYQEFLPEELTKQDLMSGDFWGSMTNFIQFNQVYKRLIEQHSQADNYRSHFDSLFFATLLELDPPTYLKQRVMASFMHAKFENMQIQPFLDQVDFLREHLGDSYLWPMLQAEYREVKALLDNPELSPEAKLYSLEGTPAEAVVDSILAQHRGKVVYLDVWATWCGPCRAMMPASKELHESLDEEQPIEFVYVCINSDSAQYKPILADQQLGGSHYFLDRPQSQSFGQAFKVQYIPYYLIFDQEGNVVHDNTHRPDMPETREALLELASE